jgi:ammonia channel protein AmtB
MLNIMVRMCCTGLLHLSLFAAVQLSVGSVRSKNAKNIVLKNLLDACFGSLAFYLVGYGFAFGDADHGNDFIGWNGFALNNYPKADWYNWFWQFTVCTCTHLNAHAKTNLIMQQHVIWCNRCSVSMHEVVAACA